MKQKTTIRLWMFCFFAMLMFFGKSTMALADGTIVYERGYETTWTSSDIAEGKWEGTGTVSGTPALLTVADGNSVVKTLSYSGFSIITIDAVWNIGTKSGNNSYDNLNQFCIGDKIRFEHYPRSASNWAKVVINENEIKKIEGNPVEANASWTIHVVINTYTHEIKEFTVSSSNDAMSMTLSDIAEAQRTLPSNTQYNSLTLATKKGTNPTTSLNQIKVTEEPLYAYSVHWKSGEVDMGEFASGYDVNGASISIPYFGYMCKDNVLYKNSALVGTKDFTLTSDNQTEYITGYSAQDAGYIVYCGEAEDVEGRTIAASGYMDVRCSGKKGAYFTGDTKITTLPAGTYAIYAGLQGKGTSTFTFKAGSTTVWEVTHNRTDTYRDEYHNAEPFTLSATSDITISGGTSTICCDNIYIVCTSGRVANVDNLGYTFSSTLPLDFTGTTVEAYTASYNSSTKTVTLNRVYKVPANTGLFIKGTADDIPVLTSAADDVEWSNNVLKPIASATNIAETDGDNTNFVLALADKDDESKGVAFLKASGAEVEAGKAYLQIPTDDAPAAARLSVVFDGEMTAIQSANGSMSQSTSGTPYYNLSGQRVVNPAKGLYIVNGKKITK